MTLEKKQVSKMFKKLIKEGDGRIFFEQVRQELHDMRDPILKSILQKFDPKIQTVLKKFDCEGLFSVVALRENDLKILMNMKAEQAQDVLRRLEQTLRKDRSKSGRMTLSRLLGKLVLLCVCWCVLLVVVCYVLLFLCYLCACWCACACLLFMSLLFGKKEKKEKKKKTDFLIFF